MNTKRIIALLCAVVFFESLVGMVLLPGVARGATINVSAGGSIQAAVNAASAGDTIVIAAGGFFESVVINKNLTLQGAGSAATTVGGDGNNPAFTVNAGVTVTMKALAASGSSADVDGGGILNNGVLTLQDVAIDGNSATRDGGGIYNSATGVLVMERGRFNGNSATRDGGAIFNAAGGSVTLRSVSITGNTDQNGLAVVGTVDAAYNWWNHTSGPGGSGPGLGDKVGPGVAFTPWKTAATDRLLTVSTAGAGAGTVSPSGTSIRANGTTVSITAVPDAGFVVGAWSGDCAGSAANVDVMMNADKACVITFNASSPLPPAPPPSYTLNVRVEGKGAISVQPGWMENALLKDGSVSLLEGVKAALRPVPTDSCQRFSHWLVNGERVEDQELTIMMRENMDVAAVFAAITYTLTIEVDGDGSVGLAPGTHLFDCGSRVILKAESRSKFWGFDHWDDLPPAARVIPSRTVFMDRDYMVRAVFIRTLYRVEVRKEKNPGHGRVEPEEGIFFLRPGQDLILYAWPPPGYACQWEGPVRTPKDRCATYVTADGDQLITATFVPLPLPPQSLPPLPRITTEVVGGNGRISMMPRWLMRWGDTLFIVAVPEDGTEFDRWVINGWECRDVGSFLTIPLDPSFVGDKIEIIAVFRPRENQ